MKLLLMLLIGIAIGIVITPRAKFQVGEIDNPSGEEPSENDEIYAKENDL